MSVLEPPDLSIYDRLRRSDEEVEAWLASGTHHRELVPYLGEDEYELLAPLARAAARTTVDRSVQVFVLPGIMGSQLGRKRAAPWPANLLWLDPEDIVAGRLSELRLPDRDTLTMLGAISYSYLALKLRLRVAGFAVTIVDYDWRPSILTAAAQLAGQLRASNAARLLLVTHSMGGLVARAALALPGLERVTRIVNLAAPHQGTLAPVQALRGTYPTVRRLAALDTLHSAERLAHDVFSSFPSLYEMFPVPGVLTDIDLFAPEQWPQGEPQPDAQLLGAARQFAARLAPGDERHACIIGTGQRTATGLARVQNDFVYEITSAGDGTVPSACAALDGADNRYINCEHSGLPRNEQVAQAVVALLRSDGQCALATRPAAQAVDAVQVSDTELRSTYAGKVDWPALSPEARRRYLNQLNLAPAQYSART
jgi:pimeloyl-ACP methyl ester carboxylesterase